MKRFIPIVLCLLAGCTFTTKEQGAFGVKVFAGEWGIEFFHETPDADEASASFVFDKNVWEYLGIGDTNGDGIADSSVE